MSDTDVASILAEWGMQELMQTFEDNGIDLTAFQLLDDATIRELIPKVGLRVKFSSKWQAYVTAKRFDTTETVELSFGSQSTESPLGSDIFDASTVKAHSPGSQSTVPVSSEGSLSESSSSDVPMTPSPKPPKLVRHKHFDVIELLERSARGQSVISNIKRDRLLSPPDRRILISLCVAELVYQYGHKPSSFHKEALAQSITEAFPCLKDSRGRGHEAFYMKGSTGRPASGWLEEHLKYTRKRMKRQEEAATSGEKQPRSDIQADPDPLSDEDAAVMRTWLLHNHSPQVTLERYMRETARRRAALVKTDGFKEALNQYPKILFPGMIEQDFEVLYPTVKDKLYEKWSSLHETVLTYAEKNFPGWREELPWDCSFMTEEEVAFVALPVVFRSRHKKKKGMGSTSMNSSVKAFIDICPNVTNIEQYCSEVDAEQRPQPFVLILWDLKQETRQFFVIFERRSLPSPSLLKAVDTCYKLHYVLDVDYQPDCIASWQFLQNIVFEDDNDEAMEMNTVKVFRAYLRSSASHCV